MGPQITPLCPSLVVVVVRGLLVPGPKAAQDRGKSRFHPSFATEPDKMRKLGVKHTFRHFLGGLQPYVQDMTLIHMLMPTNHRRFFHAAPTLGYERPASCLGQTLRYAEPLCVEGHRPSADVGRCSYQSRDDCLWRDRDHRQDQAKAGNVRQSKQRHRCEALRAFMPECGA